jgi:hypothetical protein
MGVKRYPDANDTMHPAYFLLWKDRKLILKHGPLGPPSSHTVEILVEKQAEDATVCAFLSLEKVMTGNFAVQ